MSKLHYLTALLLIILLAVASGWVFESIEKNPVLRKEVVRHDPDYFLQNFTATTMNRQGKPAYQVKAQYLEHYPDDDSMKLNQPFISFYENNIKSWTAQADEAVILQKTHTIHLHGNVILKQQSKIVPTGEKNITSITFTTQQLTIETKQNKAHTKSGIKLTKGDNQIQAVGMRADLNQARIEFLSNTRSHYVLSAK